MDASLLKLDDVKKYKYQAVSLELHWAEIDYKSEGYEIKPYNQVMRIPVQRLLDEVLLGFESKDLLNLSVSILGKLLNTFNRPVNINVEDVVKLPVSDEEFPPLEKFRQYHTPILYRQEPLKDFVLPYIEYENNFHLEKTTQVHVYFLHDDLFRLTWTLSASYVDYDVIPYSYEPHQESKIVNTIVTWFRECFDPETYRYPPVEKDYSDFNMFKRKSSSSDTEIKPEQKQKDPNEKLLKFLTLEYLELLRQSPKLDLALKAQTEALTLFLNEQNKKGM